MIVDNKEINYSMKVRAGVAASPRVRAALPHSHTALARARAARLRSQSKDPVRNVEFFEHLDSVVAQPLDPLRNVSSMLPRHFQDKKVRVFVRDASKLGVAMEALNSFAKSRKCASPIGNTPVKRARCAAADGGSQESPIAAARGDWG